MKEPKRPGPGETQGGLRSKRERRLQHGNKSTGSVLQHPDFHTQGFGLTAGGTSSFQRSYSDAPSSYFGRDGVSLLVASRLHKAKDQRQGEALSEFRRPDRPIMLRVQDKLSVTHKQTYLRKVLRSYDPDQKGFLTRDAMRAALDRLHMGLGEGDKDKLLDRLDPEHGNAISVGHVLSTFDSMHPLGGPTPDRKQYNIDTAAPWEERVGKMRVWNWEVRPQGIAGVMGRAEDGSYEQRKEDAYLMYLLSERFAQSEDKLRKVFRRTDTNRNSRVEKEEFITALEALHMGVGRQQLERVFQLADKDGSGVVDYEEFMRVFQSDGPARRKLKPAHDTTTRVPVATALGLGPEEVAASLRSPLIYELRQRLYTKASAVHALFQAYDVNGDGYLSLQELTSCCQQLVPGIGEADVGALCAVADPSGDGHLDYKEFVTSLVEGAAPHKRLVEHTLPPGLRAAVPEQTQPVSPSMRRHLALSNGEGGLEQAREAWGTSPIWTRPTMPASVRESLSATTSTSAPPSPHEIHRSRSGNLGFGATSPSATTSPRAGVTRSIPSGSAAWARGASAPTGTSPTGLLNTGRVGTPMRSNPHPHPLDIHDEAGELDERKLLHQAAVEPIVSSLDRTLYSSLNSRGGGRTSALYTSLPAGLGAGGGEGAPGGGAAAQAGSIGGREEELGPGAISAPATLTRSVDAGSGFGPYHPPATPPGGSPAEHAELLAEIKGKGRFHRLMHPNTRHVMYPAAGTSQYADPQDVYVRKDNPAFTHYQSDDREKVAVHRARAERRTAATTQYVTQRVAADEAAREGPDAARLELKGNVKARYIERCALYEVGRAEREPSPGKSKPAHIFMRAPFFQEWQVNAKVFERT